MIYLYMSEMEVIFLKENMVNFLFTIELSIQLLESGSGRVI